jgi:proteasome lid subunit RPN8/RPN11
LSVEVAMMHAALIVTLALKAQSRCNSEFLLNSWALLRTAAWGQSPHEHGAFAVLDADGHVTFVAWPFHHAALSATYTGSIPAHAFAIVHTHPNSHPMPSSEDETASKRLDMPVYVVTRAVVTRTNGKRTEYVAWGDWNPELCAQR